MRGSYFIRTRLSQKLKNYDPEAPFDFRIKGWFLRKTLNRLERLLGVRVVRCIDCIEEITFDTEKTSKFLQKAFDVMLANFSDVFKEKDIIAVMGMNQFTEMVYEDEANGIRYGVYEVPVDYHYRCYGSRWIVQGLDVIVIPMFDGVICLPKSIWHKDKGVK